LKSLFLVFFEGLIISTIAEKSFTKFFQLTFSVLSSYKTIQTADGLSAVGIHEQLVLNAFGRNIRHHTWAQA
jgi:hypothetical protein